MPDEEFINELQRLNGTPEEVLQNRELMQLFLPLLRADFQIADTYVSDQTVLNCPITILAGTEDVGIKPPHLESWKELTSSAGEVHYVPGDHFFIEKNKQLVFRILSEKIESVLTKNAAGMLAGSVANQLTLAMNH